MKLRHTIIMVVSMALAALTVQAGDKDAPDVKTMVLVKSGSFVMGNGDYENAKPHKVTLTHDYYIGKHEVTTEQFCDILNYAYKKGYIDKKALADHGHKQAVKTTTKFTQKVLDIADEDCEIKFKRGKFVVDKGKKNHPVIEVSWWGGAFYCNMMSQQENLTELYDLDKPNWPCKVYGAEGYRLPTEAEWEHAARYCDGRKYPWGNSTPNPQAGIPRAHYHHQRGATMPVGSFPQGNNALGLCDMAGNVAEWCQDWYDEIVSDADVTDPVGPAMSPLLYIKPVKGYWPIRVIRGGSWRYDPENTEMGTPFTVDTVIKEDSIEAAFRCYDYPGLTRPVEGFRVVRILK